MLCEPRGDQTLIFPALHKLQEKVHESILVGTVMTEIYLVCPSCAFVLTVGQGGPDDVGGYVILGMIGTKFGPAGAESNAAAKGLDWDAVVPTKGKYKGQSRVDHVRLHNVNNPAKPSHGVFFDDAVDVTNEAWARAQHMGLSPDSTGTLNVPMGRQVGVLGGVEGSAAYVPLNSVTIKVVPGTNKVITSFPDL